MFAINARASSQIMALEYKFPALRLELPAQEPTTLWEHFEHAVAQNTERIFTARFHPLHTAQWFLSPDLNSADLHDQTTRAARGAMSRAVSVSAREVALDLPLMVWLEGQRNFLADFLLNSMGNVEETAVAPLDPAYRALERSWWQRLANNRNFSFGFRPFRTSPYAFMSTSVWSGDSLLMLAHVRYHYRNFADHQFEVAISLPLMAGVSIDVGTAYHLRRHEDLQRIVFKLARQFDNGGVVHIGVEAQERPTFLVGVAMPL